ncbi:helix-turn-helix transcriptional regulator [Methylomonas sp. MgM2]
MQVLSSAIPFTISSREMPWLFDHKNAYQEQCLPKELGIGYSRSFALEEDFNFIDTQYNPALNLAVTSQINNHQPLMVLTLALRGSSRFNDKLGNDIVFRSGFSTLTTFCSSNGCRRYQANDNIVQLRFSMSKPWLERRFGEGCFARFFNKNGVQIVEQRPISASAIQAAQCMLDHSGRTLAQPLFRHGLALAIVASELNDLTSDVQLKPHRVTPRERQLAESAREILYAEFAKPPSIEALCLRIGTNEFKLKQLFRQCYDTTPYGMLTDIRMQTAYRLLTANHCNIGSVAEAVGYGHASNFSTAFNKYFGFPPKHLLRNT